MLGVVGECSEDVWGNALGRHIGHMLEHVFRMIWGMFSGGPASKTIQKADDMNEQRLNQIMHRGHDDKVNQVRSEKFM